MNLQVRTLLPHQQRALSYSMTTPYPALFMEMRLGKTLVAIRWALSQQHPLKKSRILIVAPKAVLPTWEHELALEHIPPSDIVVVKGTKEQRSQCVAGRRSGFFLINYESLRMTPDLASYVYDAVILDESTKIRSPKAAITKFLSTNFREVPARCILAGLPAPESHMDYFTQLKFLNGTMMGHYNFWNFRRRYFKQIGYEWFPKAGTLEALRSYIHSKCFVLSRRNAGIDNRKIYEKRYVYMTPEQKRIYKQIKKEFCYVLPKETPVYTKWATTKMLWLSRIAGGYIPEPLRQISNAKTIELYDLLTGELKGEQVVVWFRFNEELKQVTAFLNSKGIASRGITGETPTDIRDDYVSSFKTGEVQVLCVQIKCGKFGVDWSCASTAIYYSNSYEMEDRAQSEDRIVHPLKKEPLLYIDLITKDTVDEDVVEVLLDKRIDSRSLLRRVLENWRSRNE